MYSLTTDGRDILCAFPYPWLEDFKAIVHQDDRRWDKSRRAWILTRSGFDSLSHHRAESLLPLPLEVLDVAFPPAPPLVVGGRRTREEG